MGVHNPKSIPLFCVSQSALHLAESPIFHYRTKHIKVDCHFVRDAIFDGLIESCYVSMKAQLADILTKALGKTQFDLFGPSWAFFILHMLQHEGGCRNLYHRKLPKDRVISLFGFLIYVSYIL